MHDVNTMSHSLEHNIGGKTRIAVRMNLQRTISDYSLHRWNKRGDALRSQKTAGILQKDRIDT